MEKSGDGQQKNWHRIRGAVRQDGNRCGAPGRNRRHKKFEFCIGPVTARRKRWPAAAAARALHAAETGNGARGLRGRESDRASERASERASGGRPSVTCFTVFQSVAAKQVR